MKTPQPGSEEFTVQGMTGVDLSLPIAGPGSRAYAFIIDWHIRFLLALAWFVFSMLAISGALRLPDGKAVWSITLMVAPAMFIYLLYHPIVELVMHGQTPGKRMAGVRVVNREGSPPSAGAILIRNAFRLIDAMPSLYVVGLVCTMVTAQRVRIGDMAAGTLLVTVAPEGRSLAELAARGQSSKLDPAALDLVDQLLERWEELEPDRRRAIARELVRRIDVDAASPADELSDAGLHARLVALAGAAAATERR
jgi:uncharacterized RDD family membrane protein YckC